jgi:hypothetical protein
MMRKVALLLCAVMALGWLSDSGQLTLTFGGWQAKNIPVKTGYILEAYCNGYKVSFTGADPNKQNLYWGKVGFLVNNKIVKATRLGNGWLFKYDEQLSTPDKGKR